MAGCSNYIPEAAEVSDTSDEYESTGTEDSYSDGASSCYTEDYEPAWIEKVSDRGRLFYVEPCFSEAPCLLSGDNHVSGSESNDAEVKKTRVKAAGKLKQWVKFRKKKLKKKLLRVPSRKDKPENEPPKSDADVAAEEPAQSHENSELLDVNLDIDLSRQNYGRRASLPEKLFGLILRSTQNSESGCDKVIVCDIIQEGEAYKEGSIRVGDCVVSVDGVDITSSNLETVLSNIKVPKKVKLTVQRFSAQDSISEILEENCICDLLSLCQWLEGPSIMEQAAQKYKNIPHGIYFLSLQPESSSKENGDVIYCYQNKESQLFKQKGMFVTLGHMIRDVATPPVLSCSLIIQNEIVHTGYAIEGQQMMVLCIPNSCANITEVQHYVYGVAKCLKLQFYSLSSAFEDTSNKEYLDQFFTVFFHCIFTSLFTEKVFISSHLLNILPSVHWLPLPPDVKIVIDDILSQFEAADFGDMSDGYYNMQRIYNILGASVFYRGYLLGSHLNKDDLLDVHLFMRYHRLLYLTQSHPVSLAVVWNELYLSRKEAKIAALDPDYIEAEGRYFILIVVMGYSIVATVLEAGGCALSASGFPPPEPFYVEQVENTLLLLEESGIYSAVDKVIANQDPPLAVPEKFLKNEKSSWELFSSLVNLSISFPGPHPGRLLSRRSRSYSNLSSEATKKAVEATSKKSFGVELDRQQLLTNMGPADGESDAETNAASDEIHRGHHRSCSISNSSNAGSHDSDESSIFRRSSKRIFSSSYDLRCSVSSQDHYENGSDSFSWLVSGPENTLFCYLHMDPAEGIFLAPTEEAQKLLFSSVGAEVLNKFFSCCLKMRTTFERSLRNKELSLQAVSPKFGLNPFLQAVYEQGSLFQCTVGDPGNVKKVPQVLDFWVIGRLFFAPEPREVYVCYQDSAGQDIVELAFRLGFGLSL